MAKKPIDRRPYPQDPRTRKIGPDLEDGRYVYVQDLTEDVFVLPDGGHLHPKVLGGAKPALFAGDLTIDGGCVVDLTNLSGTFQFSSREGLLRVARKFRDEGLVVAANAVRYFPPDGSTGPQVLTPTLAV